MADRFILQLVDLGPGSRFLGISQWKYLTAANACNPHNNPVRQGAGVTPIFWTRKWNRREVKQLAQERTASKWRCWDSNSGSLTLASGWGLHDR